jgi:two-component system sensor histidine kinase HydH
MAASTWLHLSAASGHLTLGMLSLARGRASALARPLALLSFAMFGFCFADVALDLTGAPIWNVLDSFFSALAPPPALQLCVAFVGASRAQLRLVVAGYIAFGLLALSSAAGLVTPWGLAWSSSSAWHYTFLAGWVPVLVVIVTLLVRHLLATNDPVEKARTRVMLVALAIGGSIAGADELIDAAGLPLPHSASIGTLLGTSLVAIAVFRFRLFDRDLSASTAVYASALAVAGVVAYIAVFEILGGNVAALVFGTVTVTLVLGAAVREVSSSLATQRERTDRLAVLGRFSSQMAHDLKNPLAAMKGALQFLKEERARGKPLDEQHEFIDVMLEQVERLHRVVDDYQRIGRVEAVRRQVDVNDLVRSVVALEPFASTGGVSLATELAPDLPACELDVDLVSGALENLIRNALEAMPDGGTLTVKTERDADESVALSVTDAGEGMDARRAERAFDDFYTTKPTGSGLGLAFVRRVARAHGGEASLRSQVGVGTIVRVRLPAR